MSHRKRLVVALTILVSITLSAELYGQRGRGQGGRGGQGGPGRGQGQGQGQQNRYRYRKGMQGGGMQGMGMKGGMQGKGMGMKGMKGGMQGMMGDPRFQADREMFHFLLSNGKKINREVKLLDNGIETLTESNDPKVAAVIKKHVASMYQRMEKGQPVRMGDPLFRALFQNAGKVTMKVKITQKGVHVIETSADPYVAKLLQAHAKVVSSFVKLGFKEAMKMHDVPAANQGQTKAQPQPQ